MTPPTKMEIYYFALVLVAISISAKPNPPQCGVTYFQPSIGNPKQRIVGGKAAIPHSYPWLGSLQIPKNDNADKTKLKLNDLRHLCGSTLVRVSDTVEASDILLTAAHCFYEDRASHVLLGAHSQSKPAPGQQLIAIESSWKHPSYDEETADNDLAIFKLEKPVNFSKTIQPICLPVKGDQTKEGAIGIAAGWGLLNENAKDYPDLLQQAVLPVYNQKKCEEANIVDAKIQFCAGYPQGAIDTCKEDSGGPYVIKNAQGRYVLQGVVSFGKGCARPNSPGVFVRVSAPVYMRWINDQIKNLTSVKRS